MRPASHVALQSPSLIQPALLRTKTWSSAIPSRINDRVVEDKRPDSHYEASVSQLKYSLISRHNLAELRGQ